MLHQAPDLFGIESARWRLDDILWVCDWLDPITRSGLYRLLNRLSITYKRGRQHVHSPDPNYQQKLSYINELVDSARNQDSQIVVLYLDELTYYLQPTLAKCYEHTGKEIQPLARMSHKSNVQTRIAGALNAASGQVTYLQANTIGTKDLLRLYQAVAATYPQAKCIYVIQDNWPVHFHPDILVALEEQKCPWPMRVPGNWPNKPTRSAQEKFGHLCLPIQIVTLPTYASWCNPIEKLWRWLKQEVIHMHRCSGNLSELRQKVREFLAQFLDASDSLLRYVGLIIPD